MTLCCGHSWSQCDQGFIGDSVLFFFWWGYYSQHRSKFIVRSSIKYSKFKLFLYYRVPSTNSYNFILLWAPYNDRLYLHILTLAVAVSLEIHYLWAEYYRHYCYHSTSVLLYLCNVTCNIFAKLRYLSKTTLLTLLIHCVAYFEIHCVA